MSGLSGAQPIRPAIPAGWPGRRLTLRRQPVILDGNFGDYARREPLWRLRCLAFAVHGDPFRADPGCWLATPPPLDAGAVAAAGPA